MLVDSLFSTLDMSTEIVGVRLQWTNATNLLLYRYKTWVNEAGGPVHDERDVEEEEETNCVQPLTRSATMECSTQYWKEKKTISPFVTTVKSLCNANNIIWLFRFNRILMHKKRTEN